MAPSPFAIPRPVRPGDAAVSVVPLAASPSGVARLAPVLDALAETGCDSRAALRHGRKMADALQQALERDRSSIALIAGDGDAVVDAALLARRLGMPIARIGGGLRCGDRGAPDEVNRIVLDGLAGRLYADGEESVRNLLDEGIASTRILLTGSTLADVVQRDRDAALARRRWRELGVPVGKYALVALERAENVGDEQRLRAIAEALSVLGERLPLVVCLRPQTRQRLERAGGIARLTAAGARFTEPLPHVDFLSLQAGASLVITDSSATQEETSVLGVPCFTLRYSTERVVTLVHGTNTLLGDDPAEIAGITPGSAMREPVVIPYWDGAAGRRIAEDLKAGGAA